MGDGAMTQWSDVLTALGVTIVDVPNLRDWVCWVRSQRVGLVRAELTPDDRTAALEWLTVEACRA